MKRESLPTHRQWLMLTRICRLPSVASLHSRGPRLCARPRTWSLLLLLPLATLLLDIGQTVEVLLLLVVFGRSSLQGSKAFLASLSLGEAWHGASPQSLQRLRDATCSVWVLQLAESFFQTKIHIAVDTGMHALRTSPHPFR